MHAFAVTVRSDDASNMQAMIEQIAGTADPGNLGPVEGRAKSFHIVAGLEFVVAGPGAIVEHTHLYVLAIGASRIGRIEAHETKPPICTVFSIRAPKRGILQGVWLYIGPKHAFGDLLVGILPLPKSCLSEQHHRKQ